MADTKFKIWMAKHKLTIAKVVSDTSLNEKTITKLRYSDPKQQTKFFASTYIKLFKAYPNKGLKEVFPFVKKFK